MRDSNESKGIMSKKLIVVGIILLVTFGLILGYLSADLYTNLNNQSKNIDNNNEVLEISETSNGQVILNDGSVIIYNRLYTKCNELLTEQEIADSRYVGKNKEELSSLLEGWNIVNFNSNKLVLEKSIDSYSPHYYKIGIYNTGEEEDMVAVFTFDIDGQEIVDSVTGTPITLLHDTDVEALQRGIYTKDKEELNNMMQNFDE